MEQNLNIKKALKLFLFYLGSNILLINTILVIAYLLPQTSLFYTILMVSIDILYLITFILFIKKIMKEIQK